MTKFESELWYLFCGVLAGMVLAFWGQWDIDFYRTQWPFMAVVLTGWMIWRDWIGGKHD